MLSVLVLYNLSHDHLLIQLCKVKKCNLACTQDSTHIRVLQTITANQSKQRTRVRIPATVSLPTHIQTEHLVISEILWLYLLWNEIKGLQISN